MIMNDKKTLLIDDAENLYHRLVAIKPSLGFAYLQCPEVVIKYFSQVTNRHVVFRRFVPEFLQGYGVRKVTAFLDSSNGKNAVDMYIAVYLLSKSNFEQYENVIIFSQDSDFSRVTKFLNEKKLVNAIQNRDIPEELISLLEKETPESTIPDMLYSMLIKSGGFININRFRKHCSRYHFKGWQKNGCFYTWLLNIGLDNRFCLDVEKNIITLRSPLNQLDKSFS